MLFVDYIAEHLTATGRAGIIVPEGIIFQSQTAYKQLRKMLVEEYLVAVVSLPAGVFNPYSGVKTSILILDRALAKRTDRIAFFKVENDGFDLGAQRRPINKDDLPRVQTQLSNLLHIQGSGESGREVFLTDALVVDKKEIAADGEYNLTGERYREQKHTDSIFPSVELKTVSRIVAGNPVPQGEAYFSGGLLPFIRTSDVGLVHRSNHFVGTADKVNPKAVDDLHLRKFPAGTILFPKSGASTLLNHRVPLGEPAYVASHLACIICDDKKVSSQYVYNILCQIDARDITPDQAYPSLRLTEISNIRIPLPPIEVQQEIVAEIESYQKVIDGARAVVENYRPHIVVDPEWPMVQLGEVCKKLQYGISARLNTDESGYKTFRMSELVEGRSVDWGDMKCANISTGDFEKYRLVRGDILFNRTNSIEHVGRTGIFDLEGSYCFASYLIRLSISENKANPFYVNAFMNTGGFQSGIKQCASRAIGQSNINAKSLAAYRIPLPPIPAQNEIVAQIEAEKALVNANRELIERFEKKIQTVIGRVWGGDIPVPSHVNEEE